MDLPAAEQKRELGALRAKAAAPRPLAGKSDAEALAYLQKQKAERTRLQARVATLQRQRDAFLKKEGAARRTASTRRSCRPSRSRRSLRHPY